MVLAHRTLLHNGQYLIGKVLGKPGGFGITYLALDTRLETRVAIKEYLPRDLAGRDTGQATISAHSSEDGEFFRYGLTQFLQEARTLARFDHANIVRVRNFFEENGTGYLVMDYYDGVTLADHLSQQPQGKLPEKTAVGIMMPILDGLREVHAKNFLHRDIKPQNIYLTTGNRPILLDFGAARQAMSERSRSLSVVLSEGYAPYEQYHRRGEQGPWTDIYACAAVLYHAVSGEPPPPATERMSKDELDINALGVSRSLGITLRSGLAVDHNRRPQTMAEFQGLLLGDGVQPGLANVVGQGPEKAVQPPPVTIEISSPSTPSARAFGFMWVAVALVIGALWFVMGSKGTNSTQSEAPPVPVVARAETKSDDHADAKFAQGGAVTYEVEGGEEEKRLVVTAGGKRLAGPSDQTLTIKAQKDFNGDGVMDVLITTWGGGMAYPPKHMIVSASDGKIVIAPVELSDNYKIIEERGRFLIQDDYGAQGAATVFWGFDGQKAMKVRSVPHPLKTVETTVDCLKNERKNCPYIFDVLRDDKVFRENLSSILRKAKITVTDWLISGGVNGGFDLIKIGNKTYLETSNCQPHNCPHHINILLEIEGFASGGGRLLAAYFTDNTIEPIWLNSPSLDEKRTLIASECSSKEPPQECSLLGK